MIGLNILYVCVFIFSALRSACRHTQENGSQRGERDNSSQTSHFLQCSLWTLRLHPVHQMTKRSPLWPGGPSMFYSHHVCYIFIVYYYYQWILLIDSNCFLTEYVVPGLERVMRRKLIGGNDVSTSLRSLGSLERVLMDKCIRQRTRTQVGGCCCQIHLWKLIWMLRPTHGIRCNGDRQWNRMYWRERGNTYTASGEMGHLA